LKIGDIIAAAVPFGLFFGRVANFINGELWGRPTTVPWGIVFPNAGPFARHPSQLYEAALEGVVLFIVLRIATHRLGWLQKNGALSGLFMLGYGLVRVALENVREPDVGMPIFAFGLTMGMILSIPMIAIGAYLVWRAHQPIKAATAQA
jgi:phosphatidylglycerol:prolipoprotein diacylglycerol transferase